MNRKWMALIMGVLVICGICIYYLGQPKTVQVISPVERPMAVQISHEANVTALHRAVIEPQVTGQISMYAVKVGDVVQAGQVVATLDTSALQQQLQELWSQLQYAQSQGSNETVSQQVGSGSISQSDVERARHMRDAGIITEREYATIASRGQGSSVSVSSSTGRSGVNTSGIEAAIQRVQEQINHAQIVAPMDGKVSVIYNEEQKIALEGKPLMVIQQDSPVVATLSIPSGFANILSDPLHVKERTVYLDLGHKKLQGDITFLEVSSGPSALVKATFNVEPGDISIGDFYTLVITSNAVAPALTVPKEVLHKSDGGYFVYVVTDESTVDVRIVEVGLESDGLVTILNGLEEKDRVIQNNSKYELGETVVVK